MQSCLASDNTELLSDELFQDPSLLDIGFMFDASVEKVVRNFCYGNRVNLRISCIEQEPGAVQSGHYIWPAAPGLVEYVVDHWDHETILPNTSSLTNVVELGAGCGLAGLALAQLNPRAHIVFTDHDPGALRTIEYNVKLQDQNPMHCSTQSLQWGPAGSNEIQAIDACFDGKAHNVHLIVGTDVIYAQEIVPLLFWTVNALLSVEQPGACFLMCSSFVYDNATETEIDEQCQVYGLEREILSCHIIDPAGAAGTGARAEANDGVRIQRFIRKEMATTNEQT